MTMHSRKHGCDGGEYRYDGHVDVKGPENSGSKQRCVKQNEMENELAEIANSCSTVAVSPWTYHGYNKQRIRAHKSLR
jgi:hypothetical protein